MHVAPGDQSEFRCGVKAERHHELVGRPGPGRGRGSLGIDPRLTVGQQHGMRKARRDQAGRLENTGDAALGVGVPDRSDAQCIDQFGGVLAEHGVDFGGRHIGLGEHAAGSRQRDRERGVAFEHPRLRGVVCGDDGDVTKRMLAHRLSGLSPTTPERRSSAIRSGVNPATPSSTSSLCCPSVGAGRVNHGRRRPASRIGRPGIRCVPTIGWSMVSREILLRRTGDYPTLATAAPRVRPGCLVPSSASASSHASRPAQKAASRSSIAS